MTDERDDDPPALQTRRSLLKLAGAAGVSLVLPLPLSACGGDPDGPDAGDGGPDGGPDDASAPDAGPSTGPLPVPPLLEGELSGGVRTFQLDLQTGTMEFVPGTSTATYGVNGPFLGPTLHFRRGERVRLEVTNSLSETTTLHWHGMELPAQSDGGPYLTIDPGATWITEYDVIQRPLMAWYHPHQMGETARHVYMGIAGLIYLDDPSVSIDLPSTYGVDDLPLVVQDRRFNADGTHPYSDPSSPLAMRDRMAGLKGETMLVNGLVSPRGSVPRGLVRLRILNGSNSRNFNFGFSDDRTFQHIGNEGGLFEAPFDATRVLLSPGERAEILVDFGADEANAEVVLRSYSGEVFSALFTGGMGGALADDLDRTTFDVMTFVVGEPPAATITPPTSFEPIERMLEADAVRTRPIALAMRSGGVFINNEQMLSMVSVPDAINYRIPVGDTEIWEVRNSSGMAHPLHIHHRHFQVLDINGLPPPPHLAGWKDTILVEASQLIRLILRFDGSTDSAFPYMFHCHILEHEDDGMMGQFYIVDP